MNIEIANAMYGYLDTLYSLNQKLIKLCGTDAIERLEYNHKEILDIIQDIPRLVPYSQKRNSKELIYKETDGLLEFAKDISYLQDDYNNILKDNYNFLYKVKQIRNKYEHKMHGIKHRYSGSGSLEYFEFTFDVNGKNIDIEAKEFIKLIKQLNKLFDKIVKDIEKFAYDNNKTDYPYYKRISRLRLENLNEIYESELLRTFSKSMLDF